VGSHYKGVLFGGGGWGGWGGVGRDIPTHSVNPNLESSTPNYLTQNTSKGSCYSLFGTVVQLRDLHSVGFISRHGQEICLYQNKRMGYGD
jgi:hypothetical protein